MPAKENKIHKYTQLTQEASELYYVSHTYTLFHPICPIEYQEQMCGSSKKEWYHPKPQHEQTGRKFPI